MIPPLNPSQEVHLARLHLRRLAQDVAEAKLRPATRGVEAQGGAVARCNQHRQNVDFVLRFIHNGIYSILGCNAISNQLHMTSVFWMFSWMINQLDSSCSYPNRLTAPRSTGAWGGTSGVRALRHQGEQKFKRHQRTSFHPTSGVNLPG